MDRAARGAGAKKGRKAARKTGSHRPGLEACANGRLCSENPRALFTRVGVLQKGTALLKSLAIPLCNADRLRSRLDPITVSCEPEISDRAAGSGRTSKPHELLSGAGEQTIDRWRLGVDLPFIPGSFVYQGR
jgi:hypothetical protein